jgi:hypothetical protein
MPNAAITYRVEPGYDDESPEILPSFLRMDRPSRAAARDTRTTDIFLTFVPDAVRSVANQPIDAHAAGR